MPTQIRNSNEGLNIVTYLGNGGNQFVGPNASKGVPASLITAPVAQSVRLRANNNAYLSKTFGSSTVNNKFTYSCWIKRTRVNCLEYLFDADTASRSSLYFGDGASAAGDKLCFRSGGTDRVASTMLFRDPAKWFHIVMTYDTSVASGTVNLYVDGQLAATAGSCGAVKFGNNVLHQIGKDNAATNYTDGYITNIAFVDGQTLIPTNFGYLEPATQTWLPLSSTTIHTNVSAWGTNGFFLIMNDTPSNSQIYDSTTNGHNFTCAGISIAAGVDYDWMFDTPTNSYATLNSLWPITSSGNAYTYGNLNLYTDGASSQGSARSTLELPATGKIYCEMKPTNFVCSTSGTSTSLFGVLNSTGSSYIAFRTVSTASSVLTGTNIYRNGSDLGAITTLALNDYLGIAVNCDAGTVELFVNNVSKWSGSFPVSADKFFFGFQGDYTTADRNSTTEFNFGQRAFNYTRPGYVGLTSQSITPIVTTMLPSDLAIIKNRDAGQSWVWANTISGLNKVLRSDTTGAETSEYNTINPLIVKRGCVYVGNDAKVNTSNEKYVAYLFNANPSQVTNNVGTISSQVRANTRTGFSVVTYSGNATTTAVTIGHGLGITPSFIIVKNRTSARNWGVYHKNAHASGDHILFFNTTDTPTTAGNGLFQGATSPFTTSVFSVKGQTAGSVDFLNGASQTYTAYCWAEVAGYSKFGSYVGNGSADGPFVYCGFRPKLILFKRIDGLGDWYFRDTARDTYNPGTAVLGSNVSTNEPGYSSISYIDYLSSGFKIRQDSGSGYYNVSTASYIFAAFAEFPMGDHFVPPANAR